MRHALADAGVAAWREPQSLLATLADLGAPLPDACLVWIYCAPAAAALAEPAGSGRALDEVLEEWLERNRAALNLRRREGLKLVFVNAARAAGADFSLLSRLSPEMAAEKLRERSEPSSMYADDANDAVSYLFAAVSPRFCDVFDSLEAAALLPANWQATNRTPVAESHLVELLSQLREAANVSTLRSQKLEVEADLAAERLRLESTTAKLRTADSAIAISENRAASAELERSRLVQEFEVLQVQMHQLQEELESYYRGLSSAERTNKSTEAVLAASRQECTALRQQLEQMEKALQEQLAIPRIETLSTGRMVSTVLRRIARKLVPASVRSYRARRRAVHQMSQTLAPLRHSTWFDRAWYLDRYEDVRSAGIDPVEHYHAFGWMEGRDPGPEFSTRYYLESNQDVKRSGIDPLLHFIEHGINEGRRPRA